jgi:hypothetical protein
MTVDTKSLGLGHVQRRSQFKLYAEIVLTPKSSSFLSKSGSGLWS